MKSLRARRPLVLVLAALALPVVPAFMGDALAQSIPADQSCGGLLCDMGVVGHKVEAPAPVVAPAPVAPAPAAGAAPAQPSRPRPRLARKTPRAPRFAAVPAPAVKAPRQAPAPAPVVAQRAEPPVSIAAPARAAPPAAEAPPPRYSGPTVIFQSIDPRLGLPP